MPRFDDLYGFLAAEFADADLSGMSDADVVRRRATPDAREWLHRVLADGRRALRTQPFPWRKIASYANRDFATAAEARAWLAEMLDLLEREIERIERQRR